MQPVAASRLLHAPVLLCDCSLTPTSGKALAELPATEALMERLASRSSACPARAASVVRKAGMPGRLPSRPATGSGGVPPLPRAERATADQQVLFLPAAERAAHLSRGALKVRQRVPLRCIRHGGRRQARLCLLLRRQCRCPRRHPVERCSWSWRLPCQPQRKKKTGFSKHVL